jgi:hypothetical protein
MDAPNERHSRALVRDPSVARSFSGASWRATGPPQLEFQESRQPGRGEREIMGMATNRLLLMIVLAAALSWVVSCRGTGPKHEYELVPGRSFDPSMATALVLPINETVQVPDGLEKGEDAVFGLLVAYLESKGLSVQTTDRAEFNRAMAEAAQAAAREAISDEATSVSESIEFSDAIPHLLSELGVEADLVIVPNMVIRTGKANGRRVRWDGVSRQKPGMANLAGLEGSEPVSSLWVLIYAGDGARLFSGYGGLDVLFELNVSAEKQELIEDRLEHTGHLEEGVCISLHPFFGADEFCS